MNYTHIIVGGGSAGCVLAEGLSARPRHRVLLIEAGPDYRGTQLPVELNDGTTPAIGSHDWGLWAQTPDGHSVPVPRGRVVGGTSQINSCIALRPEPSDFGGPSFKSSKWDWQRLVECFHEVENDLDFPQADAADGTVAIRRPRSTELAYPSRALIDACLATGYGYTENHNAPLSTGVGLAPLNISPEGMRISARLAFLESARERDNLTVLSDALVDRVAIRDGRAEGVVYRHSGRRGDHFASAAHVVLSAGAYGTPVILLRSGLGPRQELESLGIAVVSDLPGVGANLSDHSQVPLAFTYESIGTSRRVPCVQALLRYSSRTSASQPNDMQLCMLNHVELTGYNPALAAAWDTNLASSLTANLMMPAARGKVRLTATPDGLDTVIDYGFVDHPADLARLREGVRKAAALLRHETFAFRITRTHRPSDACLADDDALDEWILQSFQPGHHPVGTARMGSAEDPDAVVIDDLSVRGLRGLYVADASVLPEPIRANTNLTVLAVARNALRMAWAS
ncbi:GMC family oxidoreductase [Kribbella sp. NPDC051718]|uniref:GMC family oxidoreductase n=1 Tax=Kribbella sp. NPDC051718 TaxID=3155168 RepID=UPI00341F6A88